MYRLGLIGHPVAHSLSPPMHRAALETCGLEGSYQLLDVEPADVEGAIRRCRDEGWRGLNVTIPHKEAALRVCDRVEPSAIRAGAVNTVVLGPKGILGANTDIDGFVGSLRAAGFEVAGARALVLGTGGSARAVLCGLLAAGAERVFVRGRGVEQAEALVSRLGGEALEPGLDALEALRPNLVVNTTPVGMKVAPGSAAYAQARRFFEALPTDGWPGPFAYDLVYTPLRTPFVDWAEAHGWRASSGLGMLARQGALAFQRWTGVPAQRVQSAMRAALADALALG